YTAPKPRRSTPGFRTMTTTANTETTLRIIETYASIQGESTWAGLPCAFIRLARCNLRCRWCDTAYSFHGGEKVTIPSLLDQVRGFGLPLVEVTGGEPLAQAACVELCAALVEEG